MNATLDWGDPISEFLPEPDRTRAIIRHTVGQFCGDHPYTLERTDIVTAEADFLTDKIVAALVADKELRNVEA